MEERGRETQMPVARYGGPFIMVRLFGQDGEANIQEQRLYELLSDPRSALGLDPGPLIAENLLLVALRGTNNDPRPQRQERARELALVGILLGNGEQGEHLGTESALEASGNNYVYAYGPDWMARPSTWSAEIQQFLRLLGATYVLRVEMGRQFGFEVHRSRPSFRQFQAINHLVLFDNALRKYDSGQVAAGFQRALLVAGPETADTRPDLRKLNEWVFGGRAASGRQLADELKIVSALRDTYSGHLVLQPTETLDTWKVLSRDTRTAHSLEHGFIHAAGTIQANCPQLFMRRQHPGLFPFVSAIASSLGWYYQTATGPGADARAAARRQQAFQTRAAAECHAKSGVPVVAGFYRTINATLKGGEGLQPTMFNGELGAIKHQALDTVRYDYGHYLIMLGPFQPWSGLTAPPCPYAESSWAQAAVQTALELFSALYPAPCISGYARPPGPSAVIEHLRSLVPKGGLLLFLSHLPDDVKDGLGEMGPARATGPGMQQFVSSYFLSPACSNVFITVRQRGEKINGRTVLQALGRACDMAGCQHYVLGSTVPLGGLNFVNDLASPVSTAEMMDDFSPFFTVEFPPIQEEGASSPVPLDVDESMDISPSYELPWLSLESCLTSILSHPTVGSKEHLVRHTDRVSGGRVAQQPGVGPLDLPLADYAFVAHSQVWTRPGGAPPLPYRTWDRMTEKLLVSAKPGGENVKVSGTVITLGEQGYKVSLDLREGTRLAMAEALLNAAFAPILDPEDVLLTLHLHLDPRRADNSAVMEAMTAASDYARGLGVKLTFGSASCPETGSSASSFMTVVASVSAPGEFSGPLITPVLQKTGSLLIAVRCGDGKIQGGSLFEQLFSDVATTPRAPEPLSLKNLFRAVQQLVKSGIVLSGHDISDGGLVTCLVEMALAGQRGVTITMPVASDYLPEMFAEHPGLVFEVEERSVGEVLQTLRSMNMYPAVLGRVGEQGPDQMFEVQHGPETVLRQSLRLLLGTWSSFASEQYECLRPDRINRSMHVSDYGYNEALAVSPLTGKNLSPRRLVTEPDPRCQVAVLCAPGTRGHESLLAAFTNAGCLCRRVFFREVRDNTFLDKYVGLAIGGVHGARDSALAGRATVALINRSPALRDAILKFLNRPDTFSVALGELGVQVLAGLGAVGSTDNPPAPGVEVNVQRSPLILAPNASGMFESRWLNISIPATTSSVMLRGLRGCVLPCWVQGSCLGLQFTNLGMPYVLQNAHQIACHFHSNGTDAWRFAMNYPRNPTEQGNIAGLCSRDGRHLALLCDPSLCTDFWQWEHIPPAFGHPTGCSPWTLMFQAAHLWSLRHGRPSE
uniref:BNRF1 tegument protein n=1 Tax=Epstein-Barr virus (strain GD1) TaxID=10376 RepID=A0A2S1MRL4_EBVG|nr:BNRF1 tegument protein [human gammaherpesvirus 4]